MVDCDQREFSESVTLHAKQVGPAQGLSLSAILHPPAATVHTDATSSSTQDGQEEERKDPGRKRGQKGGMKLASSIRRRGVCGGRGRRGGGRWTGGRGRGRKDGKEEEAPVLSGAVCFCLYVCSHTVEINLPSGLSLWNKERRKLARSDTLREMERDKTGTVRQGGAKEKCRWGGSGDLFCPHLQTPNPPTKNQEDQTFNSIINTIRAV